MLHSVVLDQPNAAWPARVSLMSMLLADYWRDAARCIMDTDRSHSDVFLARKGWQPALLFHPAATTDRWIELFDGVMAAGERPTVINGGAGR